MLQGIHKALRFCEEQGHSAHALSRIISRLTKIQSSHSLPTRLTVIEPINFLHTTSPFKLHTQQSFTDQRRVDPERLRERCRINIKHALAAGCWCVH